MVKYDLVIYGVIKKTIITKTLNREVVLVDLIKKASGHSFRIFLTEDKCMTVLLDSKIHKPFINFLYEKNERC